MTIGTKLPFRKALSITNTNKFRIYAKRQGATDSGFDRIKSTRPEIKIRPKFLIPETSKFFTIGSCFARNIEFALHKEGVNCLTSKFIFDDELYEQTGVGARNGALNAYTPGSMLDLVRLIKRDDIESAGLLQTGDDEWCDMLMSGLKFLNGSQTRQNRKKLIDCYKELSNADVVVVTLGYTESWFDLDSNLYINRSPGANIKTIKRGERFLFHNMSALQVCDCLDSIVEEIGNQTNKRARVIFTVSPVPMHGTFTGTDVIIANQYSKSTLLSAASTIVDAHPHVDYFPSYEYVNYSPSSVVWEEDGIHIKPTFVSEIMQIFIKNYMSPNQ